MGPPLSLLLIDPALARAAASPEGLARARRLVLGAEADGVLAFVHETEALRRMTGESPTWGGYLGVDDATREVVGCASFAGAPDEEGVVEIGYRTFPPFEGRGVATAMAAAMVDVALADARVRVVRAHTVARPNASASLLARLGFAHVGDVFDPDEDGLVWRFERPRA